MMLTVLLEFKDLKLKLPAFAHTRPLLFSRTGLSNLLIKYSLPLKLFLA